MIPIGIRLVGALGAALLLSSTVGCQSRKQVKARPVQPDIVRDVPAVLRGTIASEASLTQRARPELVSGYGLVVGLPGTGGGDLPPRVAATMERQLGLMDMNRSAEALQGTIFEGKTPSQILRMKEVAVVIVYAEVIPGAPNGTKFDVYVASVNKSPEMSPEGGILYTTELHPGPPAPTGGIQTKPIARARGPIFINPFSSTESRDGYTGQRGRVLGGGTIVNSLDLEIVLDNEPHSRAATMANGSVLHASRTPAMRKRRAGKGSMRCSTLKRWNASPHRMPQARRCSQKLRNRWRSQRAPITAA